MGKRFYKPPIMVDYRKLFSVVNHIFICMTTPRKEEPYETMDRRN